MLKSCLKNCLQCLVAISIFSAHAGSSDEFFRAVVNDNTATMSTLLLRGTDPNQAGEKGQLPLILALQEGSDKAVAALLAHPGIRIDQANTAGETALMMAALKGRVDWMKQLLRRGAAVNRAGWTPLHYAASGPSLEAMTLLLDRRAELNARSPNDTTPLMMAARYGAVDAAGLLLRRGAHARLANAQNLEAADFARMAGRDQLAAELASRAAR